MGLIFLPALLNVRFAPVVMQMIHCYPVAIPVESMPPTTLFEREKQELETIWSSGIFSRATNQALLLKYVCARFFEGAADEIKEYNIAVEALGRPVEFDQKRDAIVRVEAHGLRKRLREYYQGDGAGHAVQILIPSGRYTPCFIYKDQIPHPVEIPENAVLESAIQAPSAPEQRKTELSLVSSVPSAAVSVPETVSVALEPRPAAPDAPKAILGTPFRAPLWLAGLALLLSVLIAGYVILKRTIPAGVPAKSPAVAVALDDSEDIRIMTGTEQGVYVDSFGHTWQSDRYYSGGYIAANARPRPILGTQDFRLYQNRREGSFKYDIPLKSGPHEMRLFFGETMFGENNPAGGAESTRIFDLSINGKPAISSFDVISDAGPGVADVKVFKDIVAASDGMLHLEFTAVNNPAFINAIEILPGLPGKMRPIRLVARENGIKDSQGLYWDPDRYARSGKPVPRPDSNVPNADPELFRSERFGNLSYSIPVVPSGRYTVSLYFSENWFGPAMPGGGGVGSRVFDILLNGVAVRRKFDIFREAPGAGRAAIITVSGVEPTHQGKIEISMPPAVNYACINALEIQDESR